MFWEERCAREELSATGQHKERVEETWTVGCALHSAAECCWRAGLRRDSWGGSQEPLQGLTHLLGSLAVPIEDGMAPYLGGVLLLVGFLHHILGKEVK